MTSFMFCGILFCPVLFSHSIVLSVTQQALEFFVEIDVLHTGCARITLRVIYFLGCLTMEIMSNHGVYY